MRATGSQGELALEHANRTFQPLGPRERASTPRRLVRPPTTRSYPFRSSLRSFVPRLSYLSNTSPPASPRSALHLPCPLPPPPFAPSISLSFPPSLHLALSLYPTADPLPLYVLLFFSFPYKPIRAGSLNPPVMARCIFLRRS